MAKYEKKEARPVVDAIKVKWSPITGVVDIPSVNIRNGTWIVQEPDGTTTYCESDDWFNEHYVKADS